MIDWNRVSTLQDEVGAEDFDEIVALFLDEVDAVIQRLAETPDLTALGNDLHFLKGSAAGLGFTAFVDQCQQGETLCEAGHANDVDVQALLSAYAASKSLFLEEMPKELAN